MLFAQHSPPDLRSLSEEPLSLFVFTSLPVQRTHIGQTGQRVGMLSAQYASTNLEGFGEERFGLIILAHFQITTSPADS